MIVDALKKVENKTASSKFKNVDFIYLMNLEKRPDKLKYSQEKLDVYQIKPCYFKAVYGWGLPSEIYLDLGVKYQLGMRTGKEQAYQATLNPYTKDPYKVMDDSCIGKSCFHPNLSLGAIGCTLSHLSILKDAYDCGYETIWILEDDFTIKQNPSILSERIEQLDAIDRNWDMLYTDDDVNTFEQGIPDNTAIWRPDGPYIFEDLRTRVRKSHFIKLYGRAYTHSMILRRAGMKRILDYFAKGVFLPYDLDLAFVPNLRKYNLVDNVICGGGPGMLSDTQKHHFN